MLAIIDRSLIELLMQSGTIKEFQLEEKFTDIKLSSGVVSISTTVPSLHYVAAQIKQLLNFVKSEVSIEEAKIVLEVLLNNRSAVS